MSRSKKLSKEEWCDVFAIRCRSKKGLAVSSAELGLCGRAMKEDPHRYETMSADVFDATIPFGSSARAKR